ncbi:MAG: ABC transporter substrate-binding protein [Methanotrichaceae archaeon]|nr:ABC transporter substrate-binding protein [Methanotrichaceae archaeon]
MLALLCLLTNAGGAASVTIEDYTGQSVALASPAGRIVSLSSSASELIFALGGEGQLVGRGGTSQFPPSIEAVPEMGTSSYSPNMELILEAHPEVVIADTMLSQVNRALMEDAGIAVVEESFVDPEHLTQAIANIGAILGKEAQATELTDFIEGYKEMVEGRVSGVSDRPRVFLERDLPYQTASSQTSDHQLIDAAGGENIAAGENVKYPTVSPEWVAERDPEVILLAVWSVEGEEISRDEMIQARDEILARPGLAQVSAVIDGRIYAYNSRLASGIRSVIGEIYMAKWFHPDLFVDIDPGEIHEEMMERFFGLQLEGTYVYP